MPLYADLYHYGVGGGSLGGILPSSASSSASGYGSYSPLPSFSPSFSSYGRSAGSAPLSRSALAAISRHYKPMLTTIAESAYPGARGRLGAHHGPGALTTTLTRIHSPKINVQHTASTSYTAPRPIQINTADIDVSSSRYRPHDRSTLDRPAYGSPAREPTASAASVAESPFMPRIDQNDPPHRCTIKRDRNIVRLSTMRQRSESKSRGEHSTSETPPARRRAVPVQRHDSTASSSGSSTGSSVRSDRAMRSANGGASPPPSTPTSSYGSSFQHSPSPDKPVKSSWRDRFGDDLLTKPKDPPRKSPGELILERHIIRDTRHARREAALVAELERERAAQREQIAARSALRRKSGALGLATPGPIGSRRNSVRRCPSFKDICKDISADIRQNDDLNAIELRHRRASLIMLEEDQILADLQSVADVQNPGMAGEAAVDAVEVPDVLVMVRKSHRKSSKLPYRIAVSPVVTVDEASESPADGDAAGVVRQQSPKWKAVVEHVAEDHLVDHKVFKLPKKKAAKAKIVPAETSGGDHLLIPAQIQRCPSGEDFWGQIGTRESVYLDERRRQLQAKEETSYEQELQAATEAAAAAEQQRLVQRALEAERLREVAAKKKRDLEVKAEQKRKADAAAAAKERDLLEKAEQKRRQEAEAAAERERKAEQKRQQDAIEKQRELKLKAEQKRQQDATAAAEKQRELELKAEQKRQQDAAAATEKRREQDEKRRQEEAAAAAEKQRVLDAKVEETRLKEAADAKQREIDEQAERDKVVEQRRRVADMEAQMAKIDALLAAPPKTAAQQEKDAQQKRVAAMDAQLAKIDAQLSEPKPKAAQRRSSVDAPKSPDLEAAAAVAAAPAKPAAKKYAKKTTKAKTSNLEQAIAQMTAVEPQPNDAVDGVMPSGRRAEESAPSLGTGAQTTEQQATAPKAKVKSPRASELVDGAKKLKSKSASPNDSPRKKIVKKAAGSKPKTATAADAQPIVGGAPVSVAKKAKPTDGLAKRQNATLTTTPNRTVDPASADDGDASAARTATDQSTGGGGVAVATKQNMRNDDRSTASAPSVVPKIAGVTGNAAKSPETRPKQPTNATEESNAGARRANAKLVASSDAANATGDARKSSTISGASSDASAAGSIAINDDVQSGSATADAPPPLAKSRPVLVGTKKPLHAVTSKMPASLKGRLDAPDALSTGAAAAAATRNADDVADATASDTNLSKFSTTLGDLSVLPTATTALADGHHRAAVGQSRPSQAHSSASAASRGRASRDNDNDSYCLSGEESEIWSVHYSDVSDDASGSDSADMGLKPKRRPRRNRTKIPAATAQDGANKYDPKQVVKLDTKRKCYITEEAPKYPMIATPRPLQKRWHYFSSSDESNSDSDTVSPSNSSGSDSDSDDDEVFNVRLLPGERRGSIEPLPSKSMVPTGAAEATAAAADGGVRMSTCSNDSGFEGGGTAPASPKKMLETSYTYAQFQRSGRFTAPATTIPRFKKYAVDDFHFLAVLGKGSFGKVLLAELRNTEYYYAVKCLKKDVVLEDDDVECTLIERKVLALGTNHPYLCHLFCTFQTESHLFFVMEYLNGGDLMFHIQVSGRFPEPRAKFYAAEIISGLKFLHKKGIIYRDLKLDNILLDFDGHVRIADFGMCKLQIYLDRTADSFCGTPDYMAPEVIKGQNYNQAVDWWSFGVLLYEMLIGQSPFSGCDEDELFWSICNEIPWYPYFISKDAVNVLSKLMEKDATRRMGATNSPHEDICDSDFFYDIDWKRLEKRQLPPPFKPQVKHPLDTQYFDRAFTRERVRLTPIDKQILESMDQKQFQGFTYTNPNATPS